jgi:hypothetical protein
MLRLFAGRHNSPLVTVRDASDRGRAAPDESCPARFVTQHDVVLSSQSVSPQVLFECFAAMDRRGHAIDREVKASPNLPWSFRF